MRKLFAWLGVATLCVLASSAHAQNDVLKPYVVLILDTSGSMNSSTGAGPTSCGKVDNRINHAVCAINNIVNSYGDMVFSFARFREVTTGSSGSTQVTCDANGNQNGNPGSTIPTPSGGDVCGTQGPYCGECNTSTGNTSCTSDSNCNTANGSSCVGIAAETGAACLNNIDDDQDGSINDGCLAVNNAESGNNCANNTDDDNDGTINDGCPARGACTFACNVQDSTFELLTPLVDGNNASAAVFTNGSCNTCTTNASGNLDPEIWGVSPYTFTPLAASLLGAKRYWQGLQATDSTTLWPANLAGFDPINRDPQSAVFLPKVGQTSCNPNTATCNAAANCTGANCCCATQCRPYVTILLTDGDETCTNFGNTTSAAGSLLTTTPNNDAVSISTVNRAGNVVTVVTSGAHPFQAGNEIVVAGVANNSFNGTFTVASVTNATTFTYAQTAADASSTGGTVRHSASSYQYRIETKPIGFGKNPGDAQIEALAHAGGAPDLPGVNEGYYASNEADLELAISQILADSVRSESCNGRDDDCDTRVDEDFPNKNQSCTNGQLGECVRTGTFVCKADGTGLQCTAPTVTPGTEGPGCNQKDDDCDGRVDEGLSCSSCVPTGEICDNMDNDCDGVADQTCRCSNNNAVRCDGTNTACGSGTCVCTPIIRDCANTVPGVGSCPGTQQCTAGTFGACSGQTPTAETCNAIDDDCDGVCDGFDRGCSDVVTTNGPASDNPGDASHGPILHPETGLHCDNATDDDGDTKVNDGCPPVGAAEAGANCDNATDDDNDGKINDGCPTVATGLIPQNVCHAGTSTCPQKCGGGNSFGACSGEVKPQVGDPCNNLDDDCDNAIDEDFTPADCSTNCGAGKTVCVNGQISCDAMPVTTDTHCDGIDEDCDNKIDEDWVCDSSANCTGPNCCSCGTGTTCEQTKCIAGAPTCVTNPPITVESCNCLDDNCNGQVDEGQLCPSGSTCTNCQCAFPCAAGEFPCPLGKKCDMGPNGNFCVNDPCFQVTCPPVNGHAQTCQPKQGSPNEPECVDTCTTVTCGGGLICYEPTGECRPNNCTTFPDMCTATQSCVDGTCVSNPCANVTCDSGKYCLGGQCVSSCADVECSDGQRCVQGTCVTDPCGHACPFGQACNDDTGKCIEDPCKVRICDAGQWCNPNSGDCEDDPCVLNNVMCPNPGEICRGGTCLDPTTLEPDAGEGAHVTVGGGGGCNTTGNGSTGLVVALAMLAIRRRKRVLGGRDGGVQ